MIFELESIGGPFGKRLGKRRAPFDALDWSEAIDAPPDALAAARVVWTQSAFSEYASAAAFAEISAALLAAAAPLDLVAAAGDFVMEETVHCEISARLAMRCGGAIPLEVDLTKLVRPPRSSKPLMRAAELLVRTSCVGEALTLPLLKASQRACESPLVSSVIGLIAADESAHAELGPWFLDWAAESLTEEDRAELGVLAGDAIRAFCQRIGVSKSLSIVEIALFEYHIREDLSPRSPRTRRKNPAFEGETKRTTSLSPASTGRRADCSSAIGRASPRPGSSENSEIREPTRRVAAPSVPA